MLRTAFGIACGWDDVIGEVAGDRLLDSPSTSIDNLLLVPSSQAVELPGVPTDARDLSDGGLGSGALLL